MLNTPSLPSAESLEALRLEWCELCSIEPKGLGQQALSISGTCIIWLSVYNMGGDP